MRILLLATFALPVVPLIRVLPINPCEELADLAPGALGADDAFGYSVASEGSRVAIGAPNHDGKGAVFIYSIAGSSCTLDSTIIPSMLDAGDQFGYSVSLSGELLAVAAITDDTAGENAGAVYIYEEVSPASWVRRARLVPSVANESEFGESISLWDDTVAIGAKANDRVYVFRQSGSSWVEEGDGDGAPFESPGLEGETVTVSSFGESVAVYEDTLLVGDDDLTISPGNPFTKVGGAYVYKRVGSSWALSQTIENTAIQTSAEHFGEAVALYGRWAAIGAPRFAVGENNGQGVVHIYATDGEDPYQYHSRLTADDGAASDKFGLAVALHSGILVVGAPDKEVDFTGQAGVAYQFNLVDDSWDEAGTYNPGDQVTSERVGWSVAVGSYAAIGAPGPDSLTGRCLIWSLCD